MIPRQTDRLYVPIQEIDTAGRVRQDYGDMDGLCESLAKYGLLQPVVINQNKQLIAGGRRFRAHQVLGEAEVGVVFYETLNELQLRVLEVEENVQRKDFDWRERCLAIETAHSLASREATLNVEAKAWGQRETGNLLGVSLGSVNNALLLARYIRAGDKEISESETAREAVQVLLLRKEREGQKLLAAFITGKAQTSTAVSSKEVDELLHGAKEEFFSGSGITGTSGGGVAGPIVDEMPGASSRPLAAPATVVPLSKLVLHGDCFTLMSTMPEESVDHVVTDIPYGIEMSNLDNVEEVKDEHDVASNIADFADFMNETYRVLKPNAYCVFWCDQDNWEKLRDAAYSAGYKVQRWPLIFDKTSPCKNSSAQFNWTKSTEIAMVCRKGMPTLVQTQPRNIWSGPNDAGMDHPFAKPALLWQWVLRAIALPGQTILDPYAGVGSLALAAIPLGLHPVSMEIKDIHYNRLVENVQSAFKRLDPNIIFT